ncbi:MAG: hypothetical protein H6625_06785 [Bdellovibrionaceae bacterium]|nr:hypothetical protein [Pseudobdellovibrionaceae bacterium]
MYSIRWKLPDLDLTELAKHRWVQKWSVPRLAEYFGRKPDTIQMHLCNMRKSGEWRKFKLNSFQLATIESNINKVFRGHGG